MSNIKELIRDEIKRLKAENNCGTDEFIAAKDIAYDKVFDFLDTLEEPVTDFHDLEEAAWGYASKECEKDAFKAGTEWQKRKLIEGATYNELMELYRAIRDELVKRHCDVPVNIKEEK